MIAAPASGRFQVRVLILGVACILSLGAAEVALRLFGPFPRAGKTPDHVLWRPDPIIGFGPAVNLNQEFSTNEWTSRVQTDGFGFRIGVRTPRAARPNERTVLFLGDSQTMGIQVSAESTWVSLVGRMVASRGQSWQTVNAGCNGFNTVQTFLFFRQLFERGLRPPLVVLYVVNNDLFEDVFGLPYGRYDIRTDGDLVPLSPDPEALERLARAKESPRPPVNFWLAHSALLRHGWYAYRIGRSARDVASWVGSSYLRDDIDPVSARGWAGARAAVRALQRLVSGYGGRLVIAVHPDPIEWSDPYFDRVRKAAPGLADRTDRMKIQRGYRRLAEQEGVAFVNMLDGFPEISVRQFRFALDPHANASGHRIIAGQLIKGLDRLGLLSDAPVMQQR